MNRIVAAATAVLVLAVSSLVGQAPKPDSAPTISDAHRAQFFKSQLQFNQAQQEFQKSQAELQSAVGDMTKDCGEKFTPQMGPQGDPVCVAKPEPAKPAEKK